MSGVQWRWLNHGPFDYGLLSLEDRLVAAGKVRRDEQSNPFGTPEYRLSPVNESETINVDSQFWEIVSDVVREFGSLAASSLRDITYQTAPMIEAQKSGERGVELDLDIVRPVPNAKAAVARLLQKVGQLPRQETEDGAMEDLVSDIRSLAHLRGRANKQLLG
jgi:hypothetical protein